MNTWKGLAHVALFTDDLEKTIAFYENLGGKCTMRGEAQKPQWVNQLAMIEICRFALRWYSRAAERRLRFKTMRSAILRLKLTIWKQRLRKFGARRGVLPRRHYGDARLFGGVRNAFFTGPSGEQIKLMQRM